MFPEAPVLQRLPIRRLLFLTLLALLPVLAPACFAQTSNLFPNPAVAKFPYSSVLPSWPTSFVTASFQRTGVTDMIAIFPPVYNPIPGPNSPDPGIDVFELLNNGTGTFSFPNLNSIGYNQATRVVAATADFDGDGNQDIAFAISHPITGYEDICVETTAGNGAFNNKTSGCTTLALVKTVLPNLAYMVAMPLRTGGVPQLLLEDSSNGFVYLIRNSGAVNTVAGALPTFSVQSRYALPAADGAGPIAVGDFNGDGNLDFILNGQTGNSASVYLGNGDGTFRPPVRYTFSHNVHSLLLHDMDNDGRLDLVVEGDRGVIEIHKGESDGTFDPNSMGGSASGLDGFTGNGGHLVAIADLNRDGLPDILTSTPIGISVLLGAGAMTYQPAAIYNAGPGMHSFALADFNGDGNPDLATDSPEGIAILYGNPDGTFQTSRAFAAGAPATSGIVSVLTNSGKFDAIVAINSRQAQLLRGKDDGTFAFYSAPSSPFVPQPTTTLVGQPGLFGSLVVADLNNDGIPDLAVTADGPPALFGTLSGPGILVQYGNGDGTFRTPAFIASHAAPGTAGYYGTSVAAPGVGLGGVPGVLNLDSQHLWTISTPTQTPATPLSDQIAIVASQHPHNLLAAGALRRPNLNDLIAQDGGSLKLYLNSGQSFSPTPVGDLAVDGSLTTPGQLTAPDISSTFPGFSRALGFHAAIGSMLIADLDADGHDDLLVAYDNLDADHTAPNAAAPNYLYLWFGDGTGHFPVTRKHPVNPVRIVPSRNFYQAAITDLNQDGLPDLILSDGYLVSVQYGTLSGTFGPEQHFLAGQGINSISYADLRRLNRQNLVVSNGGTVFGNPVANREVLTPNPDVNTGGITVLLNAGPQLATPAGTLVASPEPSPFESAFTLTASIGGFPPPTGTVSFSIAGVLAGSATVSATGNPAGSTATLSLAAPFPAYLNGTPLLPGTYPLTATYSGDAVYSPATLTGSHTVLLGPTSVVLTPTTPLQPYYGQPIDGTFVVSVVDSNYGTTGTYTLFDNGTAVPICTNLPLTLNGKPLACPYGNPIFLDAGVHTFTVVYNGGPANGDPVNASSTSSNTVTYTALPDITAAGVLTSSLNPSVLDQSVTFSAVFTSNVATPAGQVSFLDGATLLGTGTLNAAGIATFTTSTLAVGSHPITAAFAATIDFSAATSAALTQVVLPAAVAPAAPFTLIVMPNPITLGVGRTGVFAVTVTGPLAATLTCADTFTESACTFLQAAIPAGGGATELQVTTAAPHNCGDPTHPYFLGPASSSIPPGRPAALLTALAACTLLSRKRRRLAGLLFALAGLCAFSTLSGCGNCTDLGTRPGNYSFTVIATATDGSTRQVTVPVRVILPGE